MRLKRVRIIGFKTFADRTELNIDGDIIAVVGPNGCGKSNLVDAILWGLGESHARALRAGTQQDVIFSGSPKRKAVGYAEVSLVFENDQGVLPIDAPEVTITRRLTRGGDSDYQINKRNCRLRDIHELLADSGLGRAGYSIVGQKEIDAALAASPEDRRSWLDEAAGVQRYRGRKLESQRRLASAKENLARVTDILNEIEAQRGPLREEAERAHKYRQLTSALQEVEVGLLVRDVADAVREIETIEARLTETQRVLLDESERIEKLEFEQRQASAKRDQLDRDREAERAELETRRQLRERTEGALRLARQRLDALAEQESTLDGDSDALGQRVNRAQQDLEGALAEHQQAEAALAELRTALLGAGEQAAAIKARIEALDGQILAARDQEQRKLRAEAEIRVHRERRAAIAREQDGIERAIPELEAAVTEAEATAQKMRDAIDGFRSQERQVQHQVQQLAQEGRMDDASVRDAIQLKSQLEGRIRAIDSTIATFEGIGSGSKAVLDAVARGELPDRYLPVASAISTERDLALAIETALGGSGNDLIVPDDRDAKDAIQFLRERRAGRATFQPIPLMRPSEVSADLRRVLQEPGVIGRASELVDCAPAHRPVVDSLLGRVVLAETLDDALRLARTRERYPGWSRVVTLDGEVVHSGGAVSGGAQKHTGYGIVQRKADRTQLTKELETLTQTVQGHTTRAEKRAAAEEALRRQVSEFERLRLELEQELQEHREFARSVQDELKTTIAQRDRLIRELSLIASDPISVEPMESAQALEARRDGLLREHAGRAADAEQADARLREAETRRQQARGQLELAQRRLREAEEDVRIRQDRKANIGPLRNRLTDEISADEKRLAQCIREIEERSLAAQALAADRQQLVEGMQSRDGELASMRENVRVLSTGNQMQEIARARAESKRVNARTQLFEEYGMSEPEALAAAETVDTPEDAQTVTNRLRREIRAMGEVNLGAIDAYERLSGRFAEMDAQRADVQEGIDQVETAIRELDQLTRDRFLTTLAATQIAFAKLFEKVFPGGEGSIELSDPEHLLDSGIDIDVRLPGKRKQPLPLLSGGERSLCAATFLFALLRVKPSPLVVLDEVDAPLDGRNVERFAALIQEFTSQTQFIVITHNPTTIEAAPMWVGVTMSEGVTTLVPAKLQDAKQFVAEFAAVG
jgi:chromosome segregation protein